MSFQNWFVFWVTSYWTNSLINQAELANTTCKRLGMLNTPIMEIIQLLTQLKNATSVWGKNKKKRKKVTKCFFARSFEILNHVELAPSYIFEPCQKCKREPILHVWQDPNTSMYIPTTGDKKRHFSPHLGSPPVDSK